VNGDPRPFWRRRLLAPTLVLLGLNAALLVAYTLPRVWQAQRVAARRQTLQAELERERAQLEAQKAKGSAIRENERDAERFLKELVGSKDETLLPLLRRIEKIASELGLETARVSYRPEELSGAPLVQFVITMPLSGTYPELVSFLDRLEQLPQFVTVDELAIRGTPDGQGPTDLDLLLSAYFRAPEAVDAP
jgi:Tfp pilus assembly protein PilO